MKRFRLAAVALLLGVGSVVLLHNDEEPAQPEGKVLKVVSHIGDDGLERIGIDFD